jgi:hypothetical protein
MPFVFLFNAVADRPRVQDQGLCATCVNAAIVSAAEAAVAAAAGINTTDIAFSPVYAYYCEPAMLRSCSSGWTFKDALRSLSLAARTFLPAKACTEGYDFGAIRGSSPTQLAAACDDVSYSCPSSDVLLDCSFQNLTDFWAMQRSIRVHGAVVTRVTVHSAFVSYFRETPRGIYNESTESIKSNTSKGIPHAVVLVSRCLLCLAPF